MEKAIKAEVYVGVNGNLCDHCAFTIKSNTGADCTLFDLTLFINSAGEVERCEPCKNSEPVEPVAKEDVFGRMEMLRPEVNHEHVG